MNDLRSQLAPGWSGVNIALAVVLFFLAWPLGLLMIGYIVWGRQLGIDFSRPHTLTEFGGRLGGAWRAGSDSWRGTARPLSTGTPNGSHAPADDARQDPTSIAAERDALARERQAFETEKRTWQEGRERSNDERRDQPLDS